METNLHNYLQGIADAIKEKTGDTTINAQDFASKIASIEVGGGEDTMLIVKNTTSETTFSWQDITEAEVCEGITMIGANAFNYGYKLKSIKLPKSLTKIDRSAFDNTQSLQSLQIPSKVSVIATPLARNAYVLSSLSVDKDNTSYDSRNDCNAIIETATNTLLLGCINTKIPEGVVAIATSAFQGNQIVRIAFPASLTSIAAAAFNACTKLVACDFRSATSIPTLDNANAFGSINAACKIVVPDSLFDQWIAATNWNTLTKYIVKSSEYTE